MSTLQKLILVALCEERFALMKRREFNRVIKRLYWGSDSRARTSSLSRAFERLSDRHYLVRLGGRWKLTDHAPSESGLLMALSAWANAREFYALLGLKGPSLEAQGIKSKRGIEVELVGLD